MTTAITPTIGESTASAMQLSQTAGLLDLALSRALTPWNLGWPRGQALLVLAGWDTPRPLSVLARTLHQQPQSTTEIADRLERAQLLERSRDPRDRRLVLVGLTPAGAAVAEAIREPLEEAARAFFDSLAQQQGEEAS